MTRTTMKSYTVASFVTRSVGRFTEELITNNEQRLQYKERFADRLSSTNNNVEGELKYAEQAVIADLDWGMEALEEAIRETMSIETKTARLDHAEKMLQVCALLNVKRATAGVPNWYLSAWAHLNLGLVYRLRNRDEKNSALKILGMFIVDPLNARLEFAPQVWEDLFLPHLTSVVEWYMEERINVLSTVLPDINSMHVFSSDVLAFDKSACRNLLSKMSSDKAQQLQQLENAYQSALDDNTRLYAQYYKDCLDIDPFANNKHTPAMPVPVIPRQFASTTKLIGGFSEISNGMLGNGSRFSRIAEPELVKGRYNPVWIHDGEGESMDYSISMMPKWTAGSIPQMIVPENITEISKGPLSFHQLNSNVQSADSNLPGTYRLVEMLSGAYPDYAKRSSPPDASYSYEDSSTSFESQLTVEVENQGEDASGLNQTIAISEEQLGSDARTIEDTEPEYDFATFVTGDAEDIRSESPVFVSSPMTESEEDASQTSSLVRSTVESAPQQRPPKDFVCPITRQVFRDPVTLETGQTYERRAIQEWLDRGNASCPITRQTLRNSALPKTNYVLKRLIANWKEENPELAISETPRPKRIPPSSRKSETSLVPSNAQTSPNYFHAQSDNKMTGIGSKPFSVKSSSLASGISQVALEGMISELRPAISYLCTSENLHECESAVLTISQIWQASKAEPSIQSHLIKPPVISGLVEILSNSMSANVLRATVCILSELVATDEIVSETLTRVDSDFECLVALLKKGLWETAFLIYQLKPSKSKLAFLNLTPALVRLITGSREGNLALEDHYPMQLKPKEVAIFLLERVLAGQDENRKCIDALSIISMDGLPELLESLNSKNLEERFCAVFVLLCCMQADGRCRNLIAHRAELAPVLELFHIGNDRERITTLNFISELIHLSRRTFINQVLQIIRDEGMFNTMHMLLVHLQMASLEQRPIIASLLLQLDLLAEPRKMSMYREEAIEALVEGLKSKEFLLYQITSAETIMALQGRFSLSGKPLTEALLLKHVGFDQSYNALMRAEQPSNPIEESPEVLEEEERAAKDWEKRVAFVLASYEFGLVFEALGEALNSNSVELARPCLVSATWLTHMLTTLPDTGVRGAARQCLLEQFVTILQSSGHLEERALAMLALSSFTNDSEGLEELALHIKGIFKPLRELKKSSSAAADMLRALMSHPSANVTDLWNYAELSCTDSSMNGEVHSLARTKGRIFSGHSDGTLKVWDGRKRILHLIQEVREHTKSVTSLVVSSSGEKLYSGSLDKTVKIWAVGPEEIHCIQVHDMKDHVNALNVSSSMACFIPQGSGIKIHKWDGSSTNLVFPNKNVRCFAMTEGKIYGGGTDNSIQEIDLASGKSNIVQAGVRKLLGKINPIYAIQVYDGLLYAATSAVDGVAVKVWSLSTDNVVGCITSTVDVRSMVVNKEFVYLGSKFGAIEVWLRDRLVRVGTLHTGGNGKVLCLAVDTDGEVLFSGSADGRIQAWGLA